MNFFQLNRLKATNLSLLFSLNNFENVKKNQASNHLITDDPSNSSNGSWYPNYVPFCLKVQTYSINDVILLWDLILLVPNTLFAMFLLFKWFRVRDKLRSINFPILKVFFNLILLISLLSIMRCIVTIFVKPVTNIGDIVNKSVWLIVRLGQLSTELSVLFFGLFFAKLDSRKSIMRIMCLTIPISLVYTFIQGSMEMLIPDKHYIVIDGNHYYDLYGHGGMIFWFASSTFFAILYSIITILPYTPFRRSFQIPTKKSFYVYCLTLAVICSIQSVGSVLTYINFQYGLCILDATTFLYFTMFGPFVYIVFLKKFFIREQMIPSNYYSDDSYGSYNSNSINTSNSTLVVNSTSNHRKANNVYTSLKSASDLRNSSYNANNAINNTYQNYTNDNNSDLLDSLQHSSTKQIDFNNNENNNGLPFSSKMMHHTLIDDTCDDKMIDLGNDDFYYDSQDTKVIIAKSLSC